MNKDEILKKSRKENQNGDERYQHIRLKTYKLTLNIIVVFCFPLYFVAQFTDLNLAPFLPDILLMLVLFIAFFPFTVLAIRCKRKDDIVTAIFGSLTLIMRLLSFILGW